MLLVLPPGVNLIAAINYLVSLAGRINFTDSYTPSKADRILCMQIEKVYLMVNSQKSKYAHNLLETMFGRNQFGRCFAMDGSMEGIGWLGWLLKSVS